MVYGHQHGFRQHDRAQTFAESWYHNLPGGVRSWVGHQCGGDLTMWRDNREV